MGEHLLAIVLRRVAYGDADLVVTFFSRERGRMSGMAKSARKSVKRFGGALEPGTLAELKISERRVSPLVSIEEAYIKRPINGAMKSLERLGAVTRSLELSLAFLQEHDSSVGKFDLLDRWIRFVCENDPSESDLVNFDFQWLKLSGYEPHVSACTFCGLAAKNENGWGFDFDQGGVVCPACAGKKGGRRIALTAGAISGLIGVCKGDNLQVSEAGGPAAVLGSYIHYIIGRPLFEKYANP